MTTHEPNFAERWAGSLIMIVRQTGGRFRYRAEHANQGTPPRKRDPKKPMRGDRSRWEGHRIRKAKRLEPTIIAD